MATFFWTRVPHRNLPWSHGSPVVQLAVLAVAVVVVLWHTLAPVTIG